MKIAAIFGTRPEAIKLSPVILALRKTADIDCRVCVTGQHREMVDQILPLFDIRPDVDFRLMEPNQTLASFMGRSLQAIDSYIAKEIPDLVLVQGDTSSVLAAALAAFYRHVPIGHVEAGLRTGNLDAPWPEEANRVLTSRLTALHFAPTRTAQDNLIREGVDAARIHVTGNTVIDALYHAIERVRQVPPSIPNLPEGIQPGMPPAGAHRVVLITGHRRENFGEGFESICRAISQLARAFPEVHFVYPVHLNPNVREPVTRVLGRTPDRNTNLHLIAPQPYLPFVGLMARSTLILTDSGGVQEEAPSLGKPVLVMRETTERPEAVEAGTVRLVGTDSAKIVAEVSRLLNDSDAYASMARAHNPYGDGLASMRIARACVEYGARRRRKTAA